VGAALNALAQDVTPVHLVTGIAAGLRFAHPDDPLAQQVQVQVKEQGIERVLAEVCGLAADEPLTGMVIERYRAIKNGR
jgi:mannitol-1-phosphate 5-dehydrogenase